MHRLFVALRPPPAIRAMLSDVMIGVDGARWQDDDQLHMTLRYLGEIEARVVDDVVTALSRILAPAQTVAIAGVGRFEKRGRTDTLWAAATPGDGLTALHRKVDRACVSAGLAPEGRVFLPHITLARLSRAGHDEGQVQSWMARHAALCSPPFDLSHLVLYESHLGSGGASYDAVMRWSLGTTMLADGSHR